MVEKMSVVAHRLIPGSRRMDLRDDDIVSPTGISCVCGEKRIVDVSIERAILPLAKECKIPFDVEDLTGYRCLRRRGLDRMKTCNDTNPILCSTGHETVGEISIDFSS